MRVHAQQLSLLEIGDQPKDEPRSSPRPGKRQQMTRDDTRAERPPRSDDGAPPIAALDRAAATLLTTDEVAELLRVHPRTVQRLVERGQLAAVHLGSAVRFDPDDLGGLISGHKHERRSSRTATADRPRSGRAARVSFADRLRSEKHEHRAAQA
jgi:excisionase family DNA binding protein